MPGRPWSTAAAVAAAASSMWTCDQTPPPSPTIGNRPLRIGAAICASEARLIWVLRLGLTDHPSHGFGIERVGDHRLRPQRLQPILLRRGPGHGRNLVAS